MKKFFKYASLLFAAAMLATACDGTGVEPDDNGGDDTGNNGNTETPVTPPEDKVEGTLTIEVDKQIIQSDGKDAAVLSVLLDGEAVTSDVVFHDANAKDAVVQIPDFKFTATAPGDFVIWAEYKGLVTEGEVKIKAVDCEVPETPADPDPENLSFVRKVLLLQFTGQECGNCPLMKAGLKKAFTDYPEFNDYVVKVDAHNYSSQDPAYLAGFYQPADGWPTVIVDWKYTFGAYRQVLQTANEASSVIRSAYGNGNTKAGIALKANHSDGVVVVKAVVKAAEDGQYRVGAFLTEDGIQGQQADLYNIAEDWMNMYDDNIRIADCKVSTRNYTGHSLGTIMAGKTGEYVFVMNLKDAWKVENMELVVFVTARDEDGMDTVTNVVRLDGIEGELPYDYK